MSNAQNSSVGRRTKRARRERAAGEGTSTHVRTASEPHSEIASLLAGKATFLERLQRGAVSNTEYAEFINRLTAALEHSRRLTNIAEVARQRHTEGLEQFRYFLRRGTPAEHSYAVLLGISTFDFPDLIRSIAAGFSFSVFDRFLKNTGLPQDQLADLADIPRRTLVRRKREGRLSSEESDRMLRASRLFAKALQLFEGDRDAAVDWLSSEQRALGGARPIEVAKSELGAREVENLIDRLEHGVFS